MVSRCFVVGLLLLCACEEDTVGLDGSAGGKDATPQIFDLGVTDRGALDLGTPDAGFLPDAHQPDLGFPDSGAPDSGEDPCLCTGDPNDGPTYIFHQCTPPLEIGCDALVCDPNNNTCPQEYSCEQCGAAACCFCAACVPACVHTSSEPISPLPEFLKLRNAEGAAGQEHTITIEGFPFYIGALFYLIRVGSSGDLMEQSHPDICRIDVQAPANPPGLVPVWVSQYGGDEPWVLAGFFSYSGGVTTACTQPGYPCGPNFSPCCGTVDVPMTCRAGRCRRP